MDRIPTARPSWTDEMRAAAVSTLDSRYWVKGPKGREFGEKFAEHCGALVATLVKMGPLHYGQHYGFLVWVRVTR